MSDDKRPRKEINIRLADGWVNVIDDTSSIGSITKIAEKLASKIKIRPDGNIEYRK